MSEQSADAVDASHAERIRVGLEQVRARIAEAARRAGRAADSVRLLAVSKRHPAAAIRVAYACGQREFGENYVQELAGKAVQLQDLPDVRLRLIGHLQRNKAKDAVRLGCSVDTVDSEALAAELGKRAHAAGSVIEVLLEVNVDAEPQKAGVLLADAPRLADFVRATAGLELSGLLCIPRPSERAEASRAAFAALRELGARLGTRELSMGMSDDLEVAIEEGATMVRVGTAIFGARS